MRRWWRVWLIAALALVTIGPGVTRANGGQVRIADTPVGPYEITVYTSPTPLRAGPIDVSALVERPGTTEPVLDVAVWVTIAPVGRDGPGGTFEATREQATTANMYAAEFSLPGEGDWRFTVRVEGPEGSGETSFDVAADAAESGLGASFWIMVVVGVVVIAGAAWIFFARGDDDVADTPASSPR